MFEVCDLCRREWHSVLVHEYELWEILVSMVLIDLCPECALSNPFQ